MKNKPLANFGSALFLFSAFCSTQVVAAPCDDNFSTSGSIFTGKTYKTWADLPNTKFESAFKGAYVYTVKDGWKILQSDKDMGTISAAQAASFAKGKTVPLNIVVERSDAGSKVSMTFSTPAGMGSPEEAVKSHFCKTIDAANTVQAPGTQQGTTETVKPRASVVDQRDAISDSNNAGSTSTKTVLPCVAEICIGDGLEKLAKIKWERSRNMFNVTDKVLYTSTIKISGSGINLIKMTYRGDVEKVAPYLSAKEFDSLALPGLASIKAACEQDQLIGHYVTSSGNPTDVGISLQPDLNDSSIQRWTVIFINRKLPSVVTNAQIADAKKQLDERYADFDLAAHPKVRLKNGDGRYMISGSPNNTYFQLSLFHDMENTNRLRMHPLCGGTQKVKLD